MKEMISTLAGSYKENPKDFVLSVIGCSAIFAVLFIALSI